MDVSILVTCYDYGRFLEDNINSILSQKTKYSWEIILLWDESGDNTKEVAEKYKNDPRIKINYSKEKRGQIPSLNLGLLQAKGTYIGWLNADDYYASNDAIEVSINKLQENPEVSLVCGGYLIVNEDKQTISTVPDPVKQYNVNSKDVLSFIKHIWQPTVFMRKDKILEVGGFCEEISYVCDKELFAKLCIRFPYAYLPQIVAVWRKHDNCMSGIKNDDGTSPVMEEAHKVFDKIKLGDWTSKLGYGDKNYLSGKLEKREDEKREDEEKIKKEINILFIISNNKIGGAEHFTLRLIKSLQKLFPQKYSVYIAITKEKGILAEEYASNCKEIFYLYSENIHQEIKEIVEKNKINIIHSLDFGIEKYIIEENKIPIIQSIFMDLEKTGNIWAYQLSSIQNYLSKIVFETEKNLKLFPEAEIIPNGIDTDFFSIGERRKFSTKKKIISVGRLTEAKGADILLKVLELLPNYEILIVGDPSDLFDSFSEKIKELTEKSSKYNIKLKSTLSHEELLMEYQNSDIFLFLSRCESFPGVLLEAMSCGLLCISSNVDSISKSIIEEENGFLLDFENKIEGEIILSILEKINRINQLTEKKQEEISLAARETAMKYTIQEATLRYDKIYLEALKDHKDQKVCLIINNYNGAKYLEETILSALSQTINKKIYDIFFVDAGSTDYSLEIYKKYHKMYPDNTIEVYLGKISQPDAINHILQNFKKYAYYAWINSDDLYLPNFVASHLQEFKRDPKLEMCHSYAIFFQEDKDKIQAFNWGGWDIQEGLFTLDKNYICQPSVMFTKRLYQEIGKFNESFLYAFDFEYWQRIICSGRKVKFIPKFTVMYRIRKDNMTNTLQEKILPEFTEVIKRAKNFKFPEKKRKIIEVFCDFLQCSDHFYYDEEDSMRYALQKLSEEFEVHFFALSHKWEKEEEVQGINFHFSPKREFLIRRANIVKPDLIFLTSFGSPINSKIISLFPKVSKIFNFVGGIIRIPEEVDSFTSIKGIMVASHAQKIEMEKIGIPSEIIFLNSYGVEPNLFIPKDVKKEFDIIYCSDWRINKRQELLLDSLIYLKNKGRKYKTVFLGAQNGIYNESYFKQMRSKIRSLDGQITCVDRIRGLETPQYYQKSKIGIHLGLVTEGGARSPIEAMACGLPIIVTTDCISNTSRIEDKKEGLFASPNIKDISQKIEYLLDHPEVLNTIGKAARNKVIQEYTYDIFYTRLKEQILKAI